MARKRKRRTSRRRAPILQVNSPRGRKIRKNARVSMKLGTLKRLVQAAAKGAKTTVKAVIR